MRRVAGFRHAVTLGLRRTRTGGLASLLVIAGVSAATLLLVAVLVMSVAAERAALAQSIDQLRPADRAIRAAWFGLPAQAMPSEELDAAARAALGRVVGKEPIRTVLFRESTVNDAFVALGAVDGLSRAVELTQGRLPRRCERARCEVVQLRGNGATPRGFTVVGHGRLANEAVFGDAIPAEGNELERAELATAFQRSARYHRPAPPPLLLAEGVAALDAHPALRSSYRSDGWVVPIDGEDVAPWDVDRVLLEVSRERNALQARSVGFDLLAPTEELRGANARARVGARRLLLLGGAAAALVLAFAAFAATRVRRDAAAADRRLSLLGVALSARAVAVATHAASLAVIGIVGTWFAAAIVVTVADRELAEAALLSGEALSAGIALAAVTFIIVGVVLAVRAPSLRGGFHWLDAVAIALVVAVAAVLARGAADADDVLRERGTGVLLLALLPAVAAIAAAVVARVVGPIARLVARAAPRDAIALRLALVSLARRPGNAAAAAAFLTVTVAFAIFAATYRETLERGQSEQAAFALGTDIVLREDLRRLVPVRDVATEQRLAALGRGVDAAPVVRQSANVASLTSVTGITVLGLAPSLLETLRGADIAAPDLSVPAELKGPRVPAAARALTISGHSSVDGVTLAAVLKRRDGRGYERVELTLPGRVRLPPSVRGGTLFGLEILPPPRLTERGADAGRPAVAQLELGPLRASGAVVTDYAGWIGTGGAAVGKRGLTVTLTNQVETWFRPRQLLDQTRLPAIVSPLLARLADDSGHLTLEVAGHPVRLAVSSVAARFPSTRGDFAVMDSAALESALNLDAPGSGFPSEVWVTAKTPAAEAAARERLRRPPFNVLTLDSRFEREARLRDDALSRGAVAMLVAAAAASLVLALFAVALAVVSDLRDERGELLDLETQGAPPALLRRLVRLRQLAAGAVGIVGGLATGAVLSALVVQVVTVSATGETPIPPLELELDPGSTAAALVALAAVAALTVVVATRASFRAREAGRPVVNE